MDVHLRAVVPDDAEAIAEIHLQASSTLALWQIAHMGPPPEDLYRELGDQSRYRTTLDDSPPEQRAWVAERGGRVVGYVITGPSRDRDADGRTAEIFELYVRPELAGRGIGRLLLDRGTQDLRSRGYEEATLWVLERNNRARRFYEAGGWRTDGATKVDRYDEAEFTEMRYRTTLGNPD